MAKYDIGIDDAGRGTLCGPLVIAAVHHPEPVRLQWLGATDSKKTDAARRRQFAKNARALPATVSAVASVGPDWVNRCGVDNAEATLVRSAVDQVVAGLGTTFGNVRLLVDGSKLYPNLPPELEVHYLPRGDGYVPLIAAASMIAGHVHDQLMADLQAQHPDWEIRRGYDNPAHILQLYERGPQPWHLDRACRTRITTHALKRGLPLPAWLMTPRKEAS